MGGGYSAILSRTVTNDVWEEKANGPTLRRLFGAYLNSDNWAASRKFRAVDDGNGFISYDELQKMVYMEEHDLLFIFDIFAQQNELVDAKELLTMICIFSSAMLEEKGRFLMALCDVSKTGTCTGAEIAQLCVLICTVLSKCTGVVVKAKECIKVAKQDVPQILAVQFADAVKQHGIEKAFTNERLISQNELDLLLPSLREVYASLPVHGPPPQDSLPPPATEWGAASRDELRNVPKKADAKGDSRKGQFLKSAVKGITEADLAHLTWMTKLDEDGNDGNLLRMAAGEVSTLDTKRKSSTKYMLFHSKHFAAAARDIATFKRNFKKGVASAIGVPSSAVEVINVTRGCVEFTLMGDAERDGETLMELVGAQLASAHSALRRGTFRPFVEGAEVVDEDPLAEGSAEAGPGAQQRTLPEALAELALARRRIAELESSHEEALAELRRKDAIIAELRSK